MKLPYYQYSPEERVELVKLCYYELQKGYEKSELHLIVKHFSDEDLYLRKNAYINTGLLYLREEKLRSKILGFLKELMNSKDELVRQTVVNAAGEIGKKFFAEVEWYFDAGLFDEHHKVRNAVIGSIKKMGQVNPKPVLKWSKKYLKHSNKEIRREICHGIELRGRTHPEDILPLLKELQWDNTKRVYSTLVHVIGQIAYKKGCLEKVINEIIQWENKKLIEDSIEEILDVHLRYANFSHYTRSEAEKVINIFIQNRGSS